MKKKANTPAQEIEAVKAAWDALPDSTRFDRHFDFRLGMVRDATAKVEKMEKELQEARNWLANEQKDLVFRVNREMASTWSSAEVKTAKGES